MRILRPGDRLTTLLWSLLLALLACLFAVEVPAIYLHLASPPADVRQALAESGVSVEAYALYMTALQALFGVVCLAAAATLSVRLPRSPFVRLVSLMLALLPAASPVSLAAVAELFPSAEPLAIPAQALLQITLVAFLFLFPDGRFVPAWTRRPLWLFLVALFVAYIVLPGSVNEGNPSDLVEPLVLGGWTCGVAIMVYRYARRSGAVERQQTKWVVLGGGLAIMITVLQIVLKSLLPSPVPVQLRTTPYDPTSVTIVTLAFLLVPVSITLAVLRYRLWDVDVLIKRTLVYGVLTALLGLVYWVAVVVLQQVLRPLTQGSDLAIVGSTLAVAALFQPARRRIQHTVDRRFYRQRYDAARTLEAFSARLRHEVDLDALGGDLLAVVGQTMQPERLSLWLRPPAHRSGGR